METTTIHNSTLQFSDSIVLTTTEKCTSKAVLVSLLVVSLISICIPVVLLVCLLWMAEGLSLGFFISCMTFTLVAGYMARLYLWNKYGKEVIVIEKDTLTIYYDYKYFRENCKKYRFQTITLMVERKGKLRKASTKLLNELGDEAYTSITFLVEEAIVKPKIVMSVQMVRKMVDYLSVMARS